MLLKDCLVLSQVGGQPLDYFLGLPFTFACVLGVDKGRLKSPQLRGIFLGNHSLELPLGVGKGWSESSKLCGAFLSLGNCNLELALGLVGTFAGFSFLVLEARHLGSEFLGRALMNKELRLPPASHHEGLQGKLRLYLYKLRSKTENTETEQTWLAGLTPLCNAPNASVRERIAVSNPERVFTHSSAFAELSRTNTEPLGSDGLTQWNRFSAHAGSSLPGWTRDHEDLTPTKESANAAAGIGPIGAGGNSSVTDATSGVDFPMAEGADSSGSRVWAVAALTRAAMAAPTPAGLASGTTADAGAISVGTSPGGVGAATSPAPTSGAVVTLALSRCAPGTMLVGYWGDG